MQFQDCKKDMRVRYVRPGNGRHGKTGVIAYIDYTESEVSIEWDDGTDDVFNESVRFLEPIVPKVNANMSDPEGYAFFAKAPTGCCPCGIPRKSGRCNFH
jgi:hypothetical protein